MKNVGELCVLEDRLCIQCGDCDRCELDTDKICDNCCKCLNEPDADYLEIVIDDILLNTDELTKNSNQNYTIKNGYVKKRS